MNKKWPLHPKPSEYQLLYSWIEEVSETYEVSYKSFCKNVGSCSGERRSNKKSENPSRLLEKLAKIDFLEK